MQTSSIGKGEATGVRKRSMTRIATEGSISGRGPRSISWANFHDLPGTGGESVGSPVSLQRAESLLAGLENIPESNPSTSRAPPLRFEALYPPSAADSKSNRMSVGSADDGEMPPPMSFEEYASKRSFSQNDLDAVKGSTIDFTDWAAGIKEGDEFSDADESSEIGDYADIHTKDGFTCANKPDPFPSTSPAPVPAATFSASSPVEAHSELPDVWDPGITKDFSQDAHSWGGQVYIQYDRFVWRMASSLLGPLVLSFPIFSILVHTWTRKVEPWMTPYGTVIRQAKTQGAMSEMWVRGAEAVMSAFLLSTVYCAYMDGDKLTKMELYLLEGIYVCASLTYALLNSMHRVHVNSEWHWRLMNEEWDFMERTNVTTVTPNRQEAKLSVWRICESVLRHSGSEVPQAAVRGRQINSGKSGGAGGGGSGSGLRGVSPEPGTNGANRPVPVLKHSETINTASPKSTAAVSYKPLWTGGAPLAGRRSISSNRSALIEESAVQDAQRAAGKEEASVEDSEDGLDAGGAPGQASGGGVTFNARAGLKKAIAAVAAVTGKGESEREKADRVLMMANRLPADTKVHRIALHGAGLVAVGPTLWRLYLAFSEKFVLSTIEPRPNYRGPPTTYRERLLKLIRQSWEHGISVIGRTTPGQFMARFGLCIFNFLAVLGILYCASLAAAAYKRRLRRAGALSAILSFREARRYGLPHFSLTNVTNIKCWLVARSYLVRQGPQFSIDAIVSVLFVLTCATWSWVCFQVIQTNAVLCAETAFILVFASLLGFFLMHIVWLGSEINNQFHDVITLFNEQIKCNTLAVQYPEHQPAYLRCERILDVLIKVQKEAKNPINVMGLSFSTGLSRFLLTVMISALGTVITRILGFHIALNFGIFGL